MKILYCLCCLGCSLLYNNAAQAYFSPLHKETNAKQNFMAQKPLSSAPQIKYAGVNFVSKEPISETDVSQGDDLDENPIKEVICHDGEMNVEGICIDVSECQKDFPLSTVSKTVGTYVTKNCGDGYRYCYTSCQTGWTKDGCQCNSNSCTEYPLSNLKGANCNGISSCKSGDTYMYKCNDCTTGYKLNNGACIEKGCEDYSETHLASLTEHCVEMSAAKVGENYCYQCNKCEIGWEIYSGVCIPKTCIYSNAEIANCITNTVTRTGDKLCFECTKCENGYTLNNKHTSCTANSCPANYASNMSDLANCTNIKVIKAGTGFCYKCNN